MDEITKDTRFNHVTKDPRFKKLSKKQTKVKVDNRFESMFYEKKFQINYNTDKRGRPTKIGKLEDLKQYYELSDSESQDEESDNENEKPKPCEDLSKSETNEVYNDLMPAIKVKKKDQKALTPEIKKKLKDLTIDYARGEGTIYSDSSSDEESSEESNIYEFDHEWGELDKDAEHTEESTNRLAVCNMNWDRIEAKDLMVLFNSFLPPGGLIHSVTIYPSEFGLQRMKEEEEKGPLELTENPLDAEIELDQVQVEKIRKYQINRLKYYYAVVVCDSVKTADCLYKECDGLEYESSSNKLDLRFISNDITFDQEPKEVCTSMPDLAQYKPRLFTTSALTKAKVDLTWDETDPVRQEIVKSIHNGKVDKNHLKKFLACSSSSSEDESEYKKDSKENDSNKSEEDEINKYKALLADIESKEKNKKKNEVNLEVSWNLELENKANEIVKEVANEKDQQTPFEQFLEKKKKKKQKKKEEKKNEREQKSQDSEGNAFSDDDIPSDIDLNDAYFKEEMKDFKTKKVNKKKLRDINLEDEEEKHKKAELELLVLDNEPENMHFNLKKIENNEKNSRKKRKNIKSTDHLIDDFKIDVNDERFSALFTSHLYNIDPSDPQFKFTKGNKELIAEKLRRRELELKNLTSKDEPINKKPRNSELSCLVKKIKANTSDICTKRVHSK